MASESNERRMIIDHPTDLDPPDDAGHRRGSHRRLRPIDGSDPRGSFVSSTKRMTSSATRRSSCSKLRVSNPYRRPMAAANVVVSALVLIGSFLLSWRRRLAQWWIKQAVAAKLIWIGAYTVTLVSHINLTFTPLPAEPQDDYPVGARSGAWSSSARSTRRFTSRLPTERRGRTSPSSSATSAA